jgi:branched-chain amino acid transport system substrate-binding protein
MGLFDKKYCDFCGEKIGLLGNRKLEDGNMCKDCAKKLSPFCDDRRSSTVEHIKAAGPAHDYYIFSWPYVTYNSLDEINPETDPVMYKFCEDYMAKYNEMPYHDCAYRQYDSILALAAAAEAAGSIDSDAMAEALNTKVNNIQGLGGVIDFTSDANGPHEGLVEYTAWIILNEQFVRLDEWVQSDEFKAMQAEFGAN